MGVGFGEVAEAYAGLGEKRGGDCVIVDELFGGTVRDENWKGRLGLPA